MRPAKADIWLRNITLVVMTCNLLNAMFPVRPMVWRLLLLLLCVYVLLKRWNDLVPLEKWMFVLSGINFIYFLLAYVSRDVSATSVANNLCAFLPISVFVYLSRKGSITDRFLSFMTVVLLLASIGYYINYERMRILSYDMVDSEALTINASTVFVLLLPLLFYEKNRVLFFSELAICIFFIVAAVKRGNIVASILPIVLLMYYQYRQSKKNLLAMLFLVITVAVGTYFLREYILDNSYFLRRLDDTLNGETSNRTRIYHDSFFIWWNSDFFQVFFGNGYRAVTRFLHIPAHNDWLEILVDNGLFGFVLYLCVFISFYKLIQKTTEEPDRFVLMSAFLIWFAKSLYSMAYVENYLYLLMISIGYVVGKQKRPKSLVYG